jgi:hypothetical protein
MGNNILSKLRGGGMIAGTYSDALDVLEGSQLLSSENITQDVYRVGSGSDVVVIHEMPGI